MGQWADRFRAMVSRVGTYPAWEVAVELLLIGLVVWAVARFVRGTRAAGALKGLLVILVAGTVLARVAGGREAFQRVVFLYDRFLAIAAVALVVIFQPELRRAIIRLGEAPFLRAGSPRLVRAVEAIADACAYLSKSRFGALVVVERQVPLRGIVEGGTPLGAELSARLLQTIFFPGTALHDLAVIVQGNVVQAAGVQLPLADPADMPDPRLGSRHRAAVGLTKECDALVVVVSEETGHIRIAERGRLSEPLAREDFRDELLRRLRVQPSPADTPTAAQVSAESAADAVEPARAESAKEDAA
ncbi:MAG: TIGR00159 family protein [Phycisphaerae bacterium]|nr:TIGR00159 family protein [Phycisphaerae bacterium]